MANKPLVSIVMGSDSDLDIMNEAAKALAEFDIPYEIDITSAHRSPARTSEYSRGLKARGVEVVIAGAGGAAHLAGVIAAETTLPVIAVPIPSTALLGLDSLLAMVQMPAGIPVATVAIGKPGATNAGILGGADHWPARRRSGEEARWPQREAGQRRGSQVEEAEGESQAVSATLAQISFAELLAANESDTAKWRKWFDEQPAAVLDVRLSIALAKDVREFLLHIFAVELRYAERLTGSPVTDYETLPTETVAELFGIGDRARAMYRSYLASATDDDLASVMEFPTRTAGVIRSSKRKMLAHALIHSVRHWAQLATALREAGYPTNWGKDFLYTDAME